MAARRYREDHAGDRAAALAFATLLSMLPLLLLALSALGRAGVGPDRLEAVRHWVLQNFVPDTARGVQDLLERTLTSLQRASRGLGIVGAVALILTGWKLLATLQRTFEQIWGARDFRARLRKILGFWGTVIAAPFLVAASILLSSAAGAAGAAGGLPSALLAGPVAWILSIALVWTGILVIFRLFAGTRIAWKDAALGATAAAALWEALRVGFALYLKHTLLTRTVLTGMGVIPVFLVWLYLSWAVFLLGAELAFVAHDYDGALRRCGLEPPAT